MLQTGLGSKASKGAKKGIITKTQPGSTSFLTLNAKESYQKLKQTFCEKPILQNFDVSKPIQVETNALGKVIGKVLCQQDIVMNWHLFAYYFRKILPAERNYEIHDAEWLDIVESYKTWRHYLERAAHIIFVFTNHNNLMKFMKTTRLSNRQIR